MFNTFVFNGLGFNYLGLFHYSWDEKPAMVDVYISTPGMVQKRDDKPVMVDGLLL